MPDLVEPKDLPPSLSSSYCSLDKIPANGDKYRQEGSCDHHVGQKIKSAIFSTCKAVHSTKFTQVVHSAT